MENNIIKKRYILNNLDCPSCAEKINSRISELSEISNAVLNFITKELVISFDNKHDEKILENQIFEIIKQIEPVVIPEEYKKHEHIIKENSHKAVIMRIIAGVVFLVSGIIFDIFELPFALILSVFIIGYLVIGYDVLLTAGRNILHGDWFDENFLMSIATIGAFAIGEFPEALAVMLFYQVGELFQSIAVNKSRKSISKLMNIRPDFANVKHGADVFNVPPEAVGVGDIIVVKAGERIPLDGTVLEGTSSIDTSSLTGESIPRDVSLGDEVLSGTININGLLEITVTKSYGESTVSKILTLIEEAEGKKSKTESFITKFSKIYTPIVVLMAIVIGVIIPIAFGLDFSSWLYKGLLFLIISCPCALVVSIPLSYFSGIGKASREGVLLKGSNYFEALCNIKTVVFDKTGTLTKGHFSVSKAEAVGITEEELIKIAAYAEHYSNHPISEAIRYAYKDGIDTSLIKDYKEIAGEGIEVSLAGKSVLAGNNRLLQRHGIIPPTFDETLVYIAIDGKYSGAVILDDELKETSVATIKALKSSGINRIVMLTGDNSKKAHSVAERLGIDEVYSELLPQDKCARLDLLMGELKKDESLVFVGDGINDAPVLTMASVGVAMGGVGSDSAIEAADAVIMDDEPIRLIGAINIARHTRRIAWQNIIFAIGVKLAVQVLAVLGLTNMWAAVFADVGVTILAVLNAIRILKSNSNIDKLITK